MSDHATNMDRLFDLAGMVCDDIASSEEFVELDSILRADGAARKWYLCYCQTHIGLKLELRAKLATQAVYQQIGIEPPVAGSTGLQILGKDTRAVFPTPTLAANFFNSSLTNLSSGWPVAYLIATVIFVVGAIIGSVTHVSRYSEVADSRPTTADKRQTELQPKADVVGQITGMADCRWNGNVAGSRNVTLGCRYQLLSGLVEITYDTGAKVLLQGPCSYTVESPVGGYLAIGKLTARVEKKGEGGREKVASGNQQSTINNQQSSSPQSLAPSPLFAVRTPTAIVIDLGTEFGVEVDGAGESMTQVYAGTVQISRPEMKDDGKSPLLLRAGQSAQCSRGKATVVSASPEPAKRFVRSLGLDMASHMPIVETFDGQRLGKDFEQVPSDCFAIGAGAAVYKQPVLREGKQSRGYIRTVASDFCSHDFTFEATLEIRLAASHQRNRTHYVFFGIGDGTPNPGYFDDVSTGLVLAFLIDDGSVWVRSCRPDSTLAKPNVATIADVAPAGSLGPGRHRFRMWKSGKWVRFAIDKDFDGERQDNFVSGSIALPNVAPLLNAANSHLFVGTGNGDSMTVRFEDITITYRDNVYQKEESKPHD